MNGIIYNRVSTEEQERNGASPEYQKESCLRFAKENNIEVSEKHIFQESYSGAFFDRPKLSQILEIIEKNYLKPESERIDCIIILRRDRLARDVYVYNKILRILEEAKIKIFYSEESLTGEESIDEFMGNTLIGFAQYEKKMIYKRTYAGKRQKSLNGEWVFPAPYGYKKNPDKKLEIFEDEAKIIHMIVSMYIEKNMSIGAIAKALNEQNTLPPSMSTKGDKSQLVKAKSRKNSVMFWTYSAVRRILENVNKYYTGEYKAFTTKYKKTGKNCIVVGKRDEKEIITIKIPEIISKELAKLINEKKKVNKKHSKRRSHRNYLLKGKLFCDCGGCELHNFIGYYNNKKNLRNYRYSMMNRGKASPDRWCNNSISGLKIEGLVIDTLKDFFLNYDKFLIEYMESGKAETGVGNIIDEIKYKIHKLEEKKKRAINFALEGIISKGELEKYQKRNRRRDRGIK